MNASANPALTVPTPRVSWQRAFGGVWRLTYGRFFAPKQLAIQASLLAVLGLLALSSVNKGNPEHLAEWSVHFYLTFVVPVVAFISAAGLIQDDMKPATVDYILTRPLRRRAFVLYRYLSHVACLELQCLAAFGMLFAVGTARQVPDLSVSMPSLLLAQILAVPAFSALGFASGAYTNRFLIIGILYAGIIEAGIGNIPTQLNRLSMTHHLRTIAGNSLSNHGFASPQVDSLPVAIGSLVLFSLVLIALATLLFSLRETAGTKPKDA